LLFLLLTVGTSPARAAISFVNVTTAGGGGGGGASSLTIVTPASVQDDLLIAVVSIRGNRTITPAQTGWTSLNRTVGTDITQELFFRFRAATEPASFTWNFSASDRVVGALLAYRGVDTLAPIVLSSRSAGTSPVRASSVAVSTPYSTLVAFFGVEGGQANLQPPAAMTLRDEVGSSAGPNGVSLLFSDEVQATAGASGNRDAVTSSNFAHVGQMLVLEPGGVVTPLHHLRLLHDGGGLTCAPETLTLQACQNDDCSELYVDPVTADLSPAGWGGGGTHTVRGG
jgi:MSHA biogenesis protein MshQ